MFISRIASQLRRLEAERARENRREIVAAISQGQITKRDLIRWGLLTAGGTAVIKNGLSQFARSAHASVPTGTPLTNLRGAKKFDQALPRPFMPEKYKMKSTGVADNPFMTSGEKAFAFTKAATGQQIDALPSMRTSYHSLYNHYRKANNAVLTERYRNPVTLEGPVEGRPPIHDDSGKDYFGHQRWDEFEPTEGYILSVGQVAPGQRMHRNFAPLAANSMWSFGNRVGRESVSSNAPNGYADSTGRYGRPLGSAVPPLIQARYGEPIIMRIHNDLPVDRSLNGGFGRNEVSTHNHNAHTAAESDGACNAFFYPGTFYDYHWSTVLARHDACEASRRYSSQLRDKMTASAFNERDPRASTIGDDGRPRPVPGDFREIQSSMWFHDHRFFFTAENVQKGMYGLINMYSGPDCGNEQATHPGALRLPSGSTKPWGNTEFDINLAITNPALDRNDQLTFDIFDTDGYLGDMVCVNGAYCPTTEVLARRYRFRILNASMARFFQLALVDQSGKPLPFHVIANDGNLLPKPVLISSGITSEMGPAERFDIVVDFDRLQRAGVTKAYLVNLLYHIDGRKPEGRVSIGTAMKGLSIDPAVGPFLEFVIGSRPASDPSADLFDSAWKATGNKFLTAQIPVLAPVRERVFRFGRADVTARENADGSCTPDCGEAEKFPWAISVNGQAFHAFNATRISTLVPAMGDVEHWTIVNNSGGWDHPVHLHFEEGVTISREDNPVPATERLARKDVWRTGRGGSVKIQLRFSEFAGAYVQHCHNTTHEDFSMIQRVQLVDVINGQGQYEVTPTPLPTPQGVTWLATTILDEAHPDFKDTGTPDD